MAVPLPVRLPVSVREATLEDLTWFPGFASVDHIAHCHAALGRSGVRLLVAVGPQDLPLGELLLRFPSADGALVDTVCVHGPVRGIGIGTILVMAAETVAASSGRVRIELGVEATNEGAIRLYERLGYRHVASKELVADGTTRTLRIMEKAIGRA